MLGCGEGPGRVGIAAGMHWQLRAEVEDAEKDGWVDSQRMWEKSLEFGEGFDGEGRGRQRLRRLEGKVLYCRGKYELAVQGEEATGEESDVVMAVKRG